MAFETCSLCHSTVFKPRVSVTSDVYEHLRSTNTLPDNILSNTSALLLSVEKDLDDYESETHALQIRIAYIQTRRELLRIHEENLQSLLAPIRKLPNELLARVFGYVCIENDLSYGSRCPSAMALGSVCLRWRQLTIECPELWSNMTINVSDWGRFSGVQRRTASLVNLYLARSKSHPLDLSMSGSEYLGDSETPLFSQIAQQSFRWKHVFVTTDTYLFPENYRTWNSLDLPILDTLALSASDPDDGNQCSLRMLTNTPMLRAFYAWELYCLWGQSSGFPLPSARTMLHDFQYDGNVNNFCEILENCPNIHRLSVCTRGQNSTIVACPPRTLSELSSLSITLDSSREESVEESWPSVLSSLTTPHLTNLVIQRTCGLKNDIPPFYVIQSFLARSNCSLQVLSLNNIAVTDRELIAILKQCTTLEALHIVDPISDIPIESAITKAFIESLHSSKRSSIQTSPPPIVKSLRSLSLTVKSPEFDAPIFVGMISSRWIPNPDMAKTMGISCLRSVELFLPQKMTTDKNAYQPLLPFEKAGMMIVVKKGDEYVF